MTLQDFQPIVGTALFLLGGILVARNQLKRTRGTLQQSSHDKPQYVCSVKQLSAQFCRGAITLSPYAVPEQLTQALERFNLDMAAMIGPHCKHNSRNMNGVYHSLSYNDLRFLLEACITNNPVCITWNTAKKPRVDWFERLIGTIRTPDPDNTFVDLSALTNYVTRETIAELERIDNNDTSMRARGKTSRGTPPFYATGRITAGGDSGTTGAV
jgi:hypothetical protein